MSEEQRYYDAEDWTWDSSKVYPTIHPAYRASTEDEEKTLRIIFADLLHSALFHAAPKDRNDAYDYYELGPLHRVWMSRAMDLSTAAHSVSLAEGEPYRHQVMLYHTQFISSERHQ